MHWRPGKPRWTLQPPLLCLLLQNLDTDLIILHRRRTSVDLIILQKQNKRKSQGWQKCHIAVRELKDIVQVFKDFQVQVL